jgi:hypothetical protein
VQFVVSAVHVLPIQGMDRGGSPLLQEMDNALRL